MMPSLLRYFTITGGMLLGLLILVSSVLEPGGPGPTLVKAAAPKAAVTHDPQASRVERLRAEEAAAAKAAQAAAATQAEAQLVVTEPPIPSRPLVQAAAPAQVSAPASLATDPEGEAARAKRAAQEKVKAEKAKARKARLARAKAKALEEASAQQAQPYGYAPRPAYGPFGQGGGGGWNRW
jgi:NADH dehydrogenase/NADH:ubiquinone oxidoreductase subunit G